jgi:hypothetical protein
MRKHSEVGLHNYMVTESQTRSRSLSVRGGERARIVLLAASGQAGKESGTEMAITPEKAFAGASASWR